MSDEKAVVHVPPCSDAGEFFHVISPLSEYFSHGENSYFRGRADDTFFKIADKSSLPLPEDSQYLRRLLEAQPIIVHQSEHQAWNHRSNGFCRLLWSRKGRG
jgi:hypothetical protein